MIYENLIIGAGMSGLYLGHELKKHAKNFLILEKSKGVGGRLATRRINNLGLDHGAPFLKSHHLLFELLKTFHIHDGRIAPEGIYTEGGMTSLPKKMAEQLPIVKDEKIISIVSSDSLWNCHSEKGTVYQTRNLIITAPIPQALELLQSSGIDYNHELNDVTYSKGLLGIFLSDEDLLIKETLPENVHSVLKMMDRKLNPSGWVIRTTEEFSESHFTQSDDEILAQIESLFAGCFESVPKLSHRELKKWRYVCPMSAFPQPYMEIKENLFLIGDGFQYPDIRGALLSAQSLAEKLI